MPEKSKKSQEKKMETNQQNQDEIEIDLLELLRVLCSKIGYVILAALAQKCMYCQNRTAAVL